MHARRPGPGVLGAGPEVLSYWNSDDWWSYTRRYDMAAERDVERGLLPDMESPKSQTISRTDVGCGTGLG